MDIAACWPLHTLWICAKIYIIKVDQSPISLDKPELFWDAKEWAFFIALGIMLKEKKMVDLRKNIDRRLLTVREAAQYLGLAPQTLYNSISRKSKKPFPVKAKRVGRSVRFDLKDLDTYIDSL